MVGRRVAVAAFGLAGCGAFTRPNPGFLDSNLAPGESSAGSADAGEAGTDESASASSDSTATGDGDSTAGDGDGTSASTSGDGDGDGDGTAGDGDGTTSASTSAGDGDGDGDGDGFICDSVMLTITDDTFVQSGPDAQNVGPCTNMPGTGPPLVACDDLGFGGSVSHWIGDEGPLIRSYYLAHLDDAPLRSLPMGAWLTGGRFTITVDFQEPVMNSALFRLRAFTPEATTVWESGSDVGAVPTGTYTTFKYRSYSGITWTSLDPVWSTDLELGLVDVSGMSGVVALEIPLGGDVATWWANAEGGVQTGVLLESGTPPFDSVVHAIELSEVLLEIDYCLDE